METCLIHNLIWLKFALIYEEPDFDIYFVVANGPKGSDE